MTQEREQELLAKIEALEAALREIAACDGGISGERARAALKD